MSKSNDNQKKTYASNTLLYAFFVIGAIVVVNLIGTRVFGRIDLTENRVYTLGKPSKDLVKTLPDYFSIKAFMSEDLPPELKTVSRYVRDLIDEYKTSSNGKFTWSAIDPGVDKKLEEEASRCHVQRLQIQVLRNQKFELGSYYLGLCLEYGGKVESIPQVARPEGLEYQVTSLIKQMTQKKRKVAFTTGHGESDMNQGFQSMKEDLGHEFETTTVNPSSAEIGEDVDALIVGGPKQALDEKAQKEIDKFLMKGKGAVILADGMAMTSPGGGGGMEQFGQMKMGQANETGLGTVLGAYGFKIGQDFIFDRQAANGPVDIGGRKMLMTLPMFVGTEIEPVQGLTVLSGIKGLVFPYASSVELTGPLQNGKPDKGKLWKLASSSKHSWKQTGFFVFSPQMKFEPKDDGPIALGYAYEGVLKSAFAPATPAAPVSSAPGTPAPPPSESARPVRLVVIGDSDFANDEYVQLSRFLPYYSAGVQLLFNAISWTIEDEALVPLRAKTLIPRPITVSSEVKAAALQWANILGLPMAFCLFGVVRWRFRRANRLGQKL